MIKSIEVENFRGIWNKRKISFVGNAKRTSTKKVAQSVGSELIIPAISLFGKNASGKSSFLRAFQLYGSFSNGSDFKSAKEHIAMHQKRSNAQKDIEYAIINDSEVYNLIKNSNFNNKDKDLKITLEFIDKEKTIDHTMVLSHDMMMSEKITVNNKVVIDSTPIKMKEWKKSKISEIKFEMMNLLTWTDNEEISSMFVMNDFVIEKKNQNLFLSWMKIADENISKIEIDDQGTLGNMVYLSLPNDKELKISISKLSTGTKKWLSFYAPIYKALKLSKTILVIDELDRSMHSSMADFIINLFMNKEMNKMNSQFIFTSHNPAIIRENFPKDAINVIVDGEHKNLGIDYGIKEDINFLKNYINEKIGEHPSVSYKMEFMDYLYG